LFQWVIYIKWPFRREASCAPHSPTPASMVPQCSCLPTSTTPVFLHVLNFPESCSQILLLMLTRQAKMTSLCLFHFFSFFPHPFPMLRIDTRVLLMLGRCSITELHPQPSILVANLISKSSLTIIKNTNENKCYWGGGEKGTLLQCGGNVN
jgi:hypothetical protein